MTDARRYYSDAYTTTFEAALVRVTQHQGRPALVLDATYFYPTSGGQAHDTGTLDGRPVLDVVAGPEGDVLHVLDGPAPALPPGTTLFGVIDWPRRYDHMQQHSGQHLLSQVFWQQLGAETVSVHFGATESTLDLAVESVTPEALAGAEEQANGLVYANLAILTYFVDQATLPKVPLRRPPKMSGDVRIVEIDGFDYSACGGTHVRRTGEIGPIKLIRQERSKGNVRVSFLCGWRALHDYAAKDDLLSQAATLYSTDIAQVPDLIRRDQEQNKQLQRRVDQLLEELAAFQAVDLYAAAQEMGGCRPVVQSFPDRDVNGIKLLATQLQERQDAVALLAATAGDKLSLVFARGAGVDVNMGDLLRETMQAFGGGGGGRPEVAQGGGGDPAQAAAILDYAQAALERQLNR